MNSRYFERQKLKKWYSKHFRFWSRCVSICIFLVVYAKAYVFTLVHYIHAMRWTGSTYSSLRFACLFIHMCFSGVVVVALFLVVLKLFFYREVAELPMFYSENAMSCMSVVHVCNAFSWMFFRILLKLWDSVYV